MPKRRRKTEPGLANENTKVKCKPSLKKRDAAKTQRQRHSYEWPKSDSDSEGDIERQNTDKENEEVVEQIGYVGKEKLRPRSERLHAKMVLGEQNPGKREALEKIRKNRKRRNLKDEAGATEMKDPTTDLIISQVAQMSLKDADEELSFEQQARQYIQNFYPDRFTKTSVVPEFFAFGASNDRGSTAEEKVFNRLKEIKDEPMIVLHSHRFCESLEKITQGDWKGANMPSKYLVHGEVDFVIVHRDLGLIILEVKSSESATRKAYDRGKQQITKAQEAFTKFFKRHKRLQKLSVYPAGVVVMPNVAINKAGPQKGCFAEHLASNEAFKAWLHKECLPPKYLPDDIEERNEIYDIFLCNLMPVVTTYPRSSLIDRDYNKLIQLTPEQFRLLSGCSEEQFICGPAGSGKTEMIILKALNLPKEDKKLVICFNRGLKDFLERVRFPAGWNVDVKTFSQLVYMLNKSSGRDLSKVEMKELLEQTLGNLKLKGKSIYRHYYPHIFVDEAQDLEGKWEELISLLHKEGQGNFKWIFYDNNQKVKFANPPRAKHVYYLDYVIRNTRNVFGETQRYYTSSRDVRVAHDVIGPDVDWFDELHLDDFKHPENGRVSSLIRRSVKGVVEDLKTVKPGDITILMETEDLSDKHAEHICTEEEKTRVSRSVMLDCYKINEMIDCMKYEKWPSQYKGIGITVDSIRRYKGLEAKVVIVLVPEKREGNMLYDELLYVAMSRCSCKLILLCTANTKADWCADTL